MDSGLTRGNKLNAVPNTAYTGSPLKEKEKKEKKEKNPKEFAPFGEHTDCTWRGRRFEAQALEAQASRGEWAMGGQ